MLYSLFAGIVEEVWVEHVVQVVSPVVTKNVANYVAIGILLSEKYHTIFWTPYFSHCIDLVLEGLGKLDSQIVTRFATHFLLYWKAF